MVVNDCNQAEEVEQYVNKTTYNKTTCAEDGKNYIDEYVLSLEYKMPQQMFEPDFYAENQDMKSVVVVRGYQFIYSDKSPSINYDVVPSYITFF